MSKTPLRVCLLETYDTGSHHAWLTGYARHSRHHVMPLTLKGAFWKWRMHGGAVTLARAFRDLAETPDVLLATDMLDLTTFLALTRERTSRLPVALYMHENQLTYPPRPGEKRDLHYGFINYASMLCADRIWFNSLYHLESWFDELPRLLKHFPDYNELDTIAELRSRSDVLPLGLELAPLDAHRPPEPRSGPPLIVWNHRWEYDKNPGDFFAALYALADRGLAFEVAILGEHFVRVPPEFEEARVRLGDRPGGRIAQFGYAESYADYARWLWQADIVVSTAIHEFFGAAVVEALYCDCFPILPERLTYPQFVPEALRARCLYRTQEELVARLAAALDDIQAIRASSLRPIAARYDWSVLAREYDRTLAQLVQ
jgi:glycosyltransferase involved in cell wall biosynthesis